MTDTLSGNDRGAELTFAAVGRAIHHWEGVEAALAVIYSIFVGRRRDAELISQFGVRFQITIKRVSAVEEAGKHYFTKRPDQSKEGELGRLLGEVGRLSRERHLAGHGRLRAFPTPIDNVVSFDAPAGVTYRWGAEIYSADRLRTSWLGVGFAEVLGWADNFAALEKDLLAFAVGLEPSKSRSAGK